MRGFRSGSPPPLLSSCTAVNRWCSLGLGFVDKALLVSDIIAEEARTPKLSAAADAKICEVACRASNWGLLLGQSKPTTTKLISWQRTWDFKTR